jgi:hypothetical protein
VVELGQTPIDEAQLAVGVVDHDVVGLHIAVHDALRVAVVKGLQDLEHVVADVEIVEALVEFAEVSIASINELGDNGGRLGEGVTDNVDQLNNVNAVLEGLEDLNLAPDFVLLN